VPAATASKDIAENITEYIAKGGSGSKPAKTAPGETAGSGNPRMSKLVILSAFLGIGKHFIRFGSFLELVFRGLVIGVLVGVMLKSLLTESLLYFCLGGIFMDAQYVIVIAFFAVCQNRILVIQRAAHSREALPVACNVLKINNKLFLVGFDFFKISIYNIFVFACLFLGLFTGLGLSMA